MQTDSFIGGWWQMLVSRLVFPPGRKAGSGNEPVLVTLADEEPKVGCEGSCGSQPRCLRLIAEWNETEGGGGSLGAAGAGGHRRCAGTAGGTGAWLRSSLGRHARVRRSLLL